MEIRRDSINWHVKRNDLKEETAYYRYLDKQYQERKNRWLFE
ncbi:hypothetical protein NEISICOT_03606 [Neisseria sicca ATCC 29256]|uniref:Uncharacterized protein n=1 Tax=Neisseria sicca ATCC 29256 TaxID=547045 RepID=C6MAM4_NEISI|nr:hypothetical protein NEISICOT_03606 [Neisseria sicca ATCC 29256]